MLSAGAPDWFTQALACTPERRTVEVAGCAINYLVWGDPAKAPLVLIHGGFAHAMWWSAVAPQLAHHYYVIAPDLSGHGDSGRRTPYSLEAWSDDVMAVCADANCAGAPVLVGHSLGGQISIAAAALHGSKLAGIVIVDAPVDRADPESGAFAGVVPLHVYPTLASAMLRFRLLPEQPCANGFMLEHIALNSLCEVDGGWRWKFDPRIRARQLPQSLNRYLASAACPVAMMRGEWSVVVPPETGEYMLELLDRHAPLVEIPDAYHHLIVDQPLAFLAALRALLAGWEHGVPFCRAAPLPSAQASR